MNKKGAVAGAVVFTRQFLSSDPSELVERLTVLNGLKEAGNDNTRTEFTAIADELLRQDIINKEEHFQLISLS